MAENGSTAKAAEAAKAEANQAFKEKHFALAIAGYSKAIDLDPENAVYYANRAAAHLRLENYGSALSDASQAIEIDSSYVKGYYRRADANFALGKIKNAYADFKRAAKVAPRDPDLRKKLLECEKEVKRIRFEEALALPLWGYAGWVLQWVLRVFQALTSVRLPLWQEEKVVVVSEQVDLASMPIEDSYDGPRMEGDEASGYRLTRGFLEDMIEAFRQQKKIHTRFAYQIILEALERLRELASLVDVQIPDNEHFTVCGDVHGQFYDLLNIFDLNGLPSPQNPYLFNGDFVDRGSFSVEVILTLFAFKALYPQHMHLSRGNHESKGMNKIYGFDGEVKAKYNAKMADLFREAFCWLPLGHVLNERVLVVHGGLFSNDSVSLSDLRSIERFREPPEDGPMCEVLWSDPGPEEGRAASKRGVGVAFGPDVTRNFLKANGLDLLVRSHEVKEEGYEVEHGGYCITVFSAPNYCDQMGNKGAFIRFKGADMAPQFTTFSAVPHPPVRPMQYAPSLFGGMFGM